jgi:hypothetical protein
LGKPVEVTDAVTDASRPRLAPPAGAARLPAGPRNNVLHYPPGRPGTADDTWSKRFAGPDNHLWGPHFGAREQGRGPGQLVLTKDRMEACDRSSPRAVMERRSRARHLPEHVGQRTYIVLRSPIPASNV